MASWVEGSWSQNDLYNFGLPYITDSGIPQELDLVSIDVYWDFTQPTPTPRHTRYLPDLDFTEVYLIFAQNTHNMGMPYPVIVKHIEDRGAFMNCSNLTNVKIPVSVDFIDYYSFQGTGLSSVTISPDCFYYDNTFPSGCTINHYSATIDRIELNGEEVTDMNFYKGYDTGRSIRQIGYEFIIKVNDNGTVIERPAKWFTISNVDVSSIVSGQTGTLTVTPINGMNALTKTFTYNVIQAPLSLGGYVGNSQSPDEPDISDQLSPWEQALQDANS